MNGCAIILLVLLSITLGHTLGWAITHTTVATECTKLGSFYVGDRVFKCTEVSVKEQV